MPSENAWTDQGNGSGGADPSHEARWSKSEQEDLAPQASAWLAWGELIQLFSVRSIALTSLNSPGVRRFGGADFITMLRRNRTTERALKLTAALSSPTFERLTAIASLNARRQERLFRGVLVLYATLPVTLLASSGELIPDAVVRFLSEEWRLMLFYVVLFTFVLVWYYASLWRARQLVDVLDLARIERQEPPYTVVELRED